MDLPLERVRQIRDVIQERKAEEREDQVLLHERAAQGIMQAVYAAAGNEVGVSQAAGWRMFGGLVETAPEKPMPKQEQVAQLFGGGEGMVSGDEIQRLAAEMRAQEVG